MNLIALSSTFDMIKVIYYLQKIVFIKEKNSET